MDAMLIFFAVSLASTATPGPAVLYVSTRGATGGMRSGALAAGGVLLADALYIVLSVTGLSAVLAASYELFTLLKWAGVIYLLYLGVQLLRSAASPNLPAAAPAASSGVRKSFLAGFALHAANPKALLYFGSLVPQFVDPAAPISWQLALLAAIHLSTAAVVLLVYAAAASYFRHSVSSSFAGRAFRAAAGTSLVGAGISMAFVRQGAQ
jgi:homoserine/homoserine lactone efflux protein